VPSRGDDARFSRNETDRAASKRLICGLMARFCSGWSPSTRDAPTTASGAEAMTDEDQVW